MSATETKALVERLRELAEKATPGEWFVSTVADSEGQRYIHGGPSVEPIAQALAGNRQVDGPSRNAYLIVALRNALPQILSALEPLTREPDADEVEAIFAKLNNRIAYEFCCFGPLNPTDIGANDGPNWKRYLPKAEAVTQSARAALSALPPCAKCGSFVEYFDAHEAKLEWEGSHHTNDWDEWRRRYERYEAATKKARIARSALAKKEPGHGG